MKNACMEKQSVQASATDTTTSLFNNRPAFTLPFDFECVGGVPKMWKGVLHDLLQLYISAFGNTGKSLVPLGVHLYIMRAPNISLANICAKELGLHVLAQNVFKTYSKRIQY